MLSAVSQAKPARLEPPKIISLAMTSRCNLRCVMCHHGIGNVKQQDFKEDLLDMASGFISSASLVDLTGLGEPMLSNLFWSVLKTFPMATNHADAEYILTFNSNGTLLNEKNVENVLASRVRKIRISIDSPNPETYYRIRGTDLAPIFDGVRRLVERRNALGRTFPRIGVQMTVMKANLCDINQMIDVCSEIGIDFFDVWSLNQVAEADRAVWQIEKNGWKFDYAEQMIDSLPKDEIDATIDSAYAHAGRRGLEMSSLILGKWRASGTLQADNAEFFAGQSPPTKWTDKSIVCALPWKELRVTYDGDVFACCWGLAPIGNLRVQTLESIWTSCAMNEMRSDLINGIIPKLCSEAACYQISGKTRIKPWQALPLSMIGRLKSLGRLAKPSRP